MHFVRKNVQFSLLFWLRIIKIASGARTSQCANHAPRRVIACSSSCLSLFFTTFQPQNCLRQYNAYHALISGSRAVQYRQELEPAVETLRACSFYHRRFCLFVFTKVFTLLVAKPSLRASTLVCVTFWQSIIALASENFSRC